MSPKGNRMNARTIVVILALALVAVLALVPRRDRREPPGEGAAAQASTVMGTCQ